MSVWILLQIVMNLGFGLTLFLLWTKLTRPPKEDPRLSRGLQLLQSKISILEDLSDRSDSQVRQHSALLSQKKLEIQSKIEDAEKQVRIIEKSIEKSMNVAKIFQDKIPHEEIIERQTTAKYITAARLAHQGFSVEEILKQVDLPTAELEIIARMNKQQLVVKDEDLPVWLPGAGESQTKAEEPIQSAVSESTPTLEPTSSSEQVKNEPLPPAIPQEKTPSGKIVKPYQFRKIEISR